MKFKFPLNAIDKIYTEKTNLPFPVSYAAGTGPGPIPPIPPGPEPVDTEINSITNITQNGFQANIELVGE